MYGEVQSEQMVPEEWLEKMKNLVFPFNTEKRYHEEYEGFDEEYVNGKIGMNVFKDNIEYCAFRQLGSQRN